MEIIVDNREDAISSEAVIIAAQNLNQDLAVPYPGHQQGETVGTVAGSPDQVRRRRDATRAGVGSGTQLTPLVHAQHSGIPTRQRELLKGRKKLRGCSNLASAQLYCIRMYDRWMSPTYSLSENS